MTVADRIREKRIELQLSQAELARRANYSDKTAISKIENAGNDITMKQVRRIAKALNVTEAFLMGWEDSAEPSVSYTIDTSDNDLTDKARELWMQYEGLSPDKQAAFLNYLKFLQSDS